MKSVAEQLAEKLAQIGQGSQEAIDNNCWLTTGMPNLDYAISGKYRGGGFQSGRIIEVAGPPSAGKTQLTTLVMAAAQKAGGAASFRDHENAFDLRLAVKFGLQTDEGIWSYRRPETFEESLDGAIDWMEGIRSLNVLPPEAPLVVVFDSFASMVPAEKMKRDPKNSAKAYGQAANMREKVGLATASSQELPAFNQFVAKNNCLAIFLNQLGTAPGVAYGDPRYTKGGNSLPYYSSTRIWLKAEKLKSEKGSAFKTEGQKITAETVKNKCFRVGAETSWFFKFREDGSGFIDMAESMIDHLGASILTDEGIQTGAWFNWDGKRIQGKDNFIAAVNEDPDGMSKLIALAEKQLQAKVV